MNKIYFLIHVELAFGLLLFQKKNVHENFDISNVL